MTRVLMLLLAVMLAGCVQMLLSLYFCEIFCFPYSIKTTLSNHQLCFCCDKRGGWVGGEDTVVLDCLY